MCVSVCECYSMPISSGASGSQKQDSYLKRYLESLSQEKRRLLENCLEAACRSGADVETQDRLPKDVQKDKHSEEVQTGDTDTAGEKSVSKKSSTCTVL